MSTMIFPGMDPYLEHPLLWPGVHAALVIYLRDALRQQLPARYIAAAEERVYIEGDQRSVIPDVRIWQKPQTRQAESMVAVAESDCAVEVVVPELEIHEPYVTILDSHSGNRVVAVIEVVSPSNKFAGAGRDSYVQKQQEVRRSDAHLMEIDLLRAGPHVLCVSEWRIRALGDYDYLICANRSAETRSKFKLYPVALRNRLPNINIPLADRDSDVRLDLQALIEQTYDAGRYLDRIRYDQPCVPPLSDEDQRWANELIAAAKLKAGTAET